MMYSGFILIWFANNKSTTLKIGVLADNAAGVASIGSITLAGTATSAGTLNVYLGGELVQVPVAAGQAASAITTALVAAINANLDLPITAAVDGSVVEKANLTFAHKGEAGNAFDVRLNYQDNEALPAGITATVVAMASGTTNPVLSTLIAAMGDEWYQIVSHPYTDATSLTAIETELHNRFGPMRMIDGLGITASAQTLGNLATLGLGRNSQHNCIVATNLSPTAPYMVAAATAAQVAFAAENDPARPFQTLQLVGVLPPAANVRFTKEERNILLYDGISTIKFAAGGVVQLERLITTYKTNSAGASDTSYLDATTLLTLMYLRYTFRTRIQTKFPRHKLTDDTTRLGAGQAVITPKIGKAEAVAWFRDMENLGLVERFENFKRDLVVERNALDVNRLDFLLPPDIINQFIVGAVNIQFRL